MNTQTKDTKAPLDEVMMAMDVVDTLRHRQDLVLREMGGEAKEHRLIERLRDIYSQQGIEVPDHILREGVAALEQDRFVYDPAPASFGRWLAERYVSRLKWGRPVLIGLIVAVLALGAYFLAYLPYQAAQERQAQVELSEIMPAEMQALYDTIYNETKVQSAVAEAQSALTRGQTAAAEGDRETANAAITRLTDIRDTLRLEYNLRVVNRDGVRSGFWTFPDVNEAATNHYIVVEAVTDNGDILDLPILNEENNEIETVNMWGLRVPEQVYDAVAADKQNDGIIQTDLVGVKEAGYLDVKYAFPVLGGAVTQW